MTSPKSRVSTHASKSRMKPENRKGEAGSRVVVIVTHEAEQDYGLARAQEVARAKYARKQIEADGTVRVTSADCA